MAKHWRYFLFMLWFSYLIVASILLFTGGFLLSRQTHDKNSTCTSYSDISCTVGGSSILNITNGHEYSCSQDDKLLSAIKDVNSASEICLPKKAKVILLIIDALRYDFTLYNADIKNALPYQNKLPIMNELMKLYPSSTRLYKFIADPPTTTMQRLKALTTGSLPTFIDAGSNFATSEINEDNIIDQVIKFGHNITFMGDDTWVGLYPHRFKRSYPYPSFNVWDLDTVDTGIISKIYSEIERNDWSLFIGHFLGVDHCGHRYGPMHSEMTRKLTEMNNVIRNITTQLDNDTLLFVIGDHGMTSTGDHGGESVDEVTSAMFVYSKKSLMFLDNSDNSIKQVDLVPTLATILGVPIPFSNLGALVVDSLPMTKKGPLSEWQTSLHAIWSNINQITTYIKEHALNTNVFHDRKLQSFYEVYAVLNARVRTVNNEKDFKLFAKDAKEYVLVLRNMCEEVWIQFDSYSMSRGLLLSFLTIFFVFLIVDGFPIDRLPDIFMSSFLSCSYVALLVAVGISICCYYLQLVNNLLLTIFFATGITSVFMLGILIIQNWEIISINWYSNSKKHSWIDIICRLIVLLNTCALFSNSYIVEEGQVLSYIAITLIIMLIFDKISESNKSKIERSGVTKSKPINWNLVLLVVITCIFLRLSYYFWKCREEQQWCAPDVSVIHNEYKQGITTGRAEYVLSLISLALFVTFTRIWLRNCGNLVGFSPTIMLIRCAPTIMVVCTGGFWVLHNMPKDTRTLAPWQTDMFAWIVYALTAVGVLSIIISPLCVYVLPREKNISLHGRSNVIPQLFNYVKELFSESGDSNSDIPVVYGLATAYSTVFITISIFILLLVILLLREILAASAIVMYFSIIFLLIISSISRSDKTSTVTQLVYVPNSVVLTWVMLSIYFFYGTGHQPTFTNIPWDAAFIGTGAITSKFVPAGLVIIHTFNSQILMGLMLPLLLIAPFTMNVMMPSLCSKKQESKKEFARGEMVLYENNEILWDSAFVLCCKYILYHGVRVFVSMLAATIHCRHLMVWKIFAPKLIFEAIGIMVTLVSVLCGYLLLIRVNYMIDKLVTRLNKRTR